jgi:hypothetical protein
MARPPRKWTGQLVAYREGHFAPSSGPSTAFRVIIPATVHIRQGFAQSFYDVFKQSLEAKAMAVERSILQNWQQLKFDRNFRVLDGKATVALPAWRKLARKYALPVYQHWIANHRVWLHFYKYDEIEDIVHKVLADAWNSWIDDILTRFELPEIQAIIDEPSQSVEAFLIGDEEYYSSIKRLAMLEGILNEPGWVSQWRWWHGQIYGSTVQVAYVSSKLFDNRFRLGLSALWNENYNHCSVYTEVRDTATEICLCQTIHRLSLSEANEDRNHRLFVKMNKDAIAWQEWFNKNRDWLYKEVDNPGSVIVRLTQTFKHHTRMKEKRLKKMIENGILRNKAKTEAELHDHVGLLVCYSRYVRQQVSGIKEEVVVQALGRILQNSGS